jgi:hypothetical protein
VVGPLAVWHAIWTPFAQPATIKKRMISCVISAGKVSPYSAPGIRFSYLQSVTFSTHCCAVVQRTPIALDSNDTTGSALLHPFTCSTAHAIAPDGSTANSHARGAAHGPFRPTRRRRSQWRHMCRGWRRCCSSNHLSGSTRCIAPTRCRPRGAASPTHSTVQKRPHPHATPSGCTHRRFKSEKCRTGVADGRTPFDEAVSYLERPKPTVAMLAAARTAAGV